MTCANGDSAPCRDGGVEWRMTILSNKFNNLMARMECCFVSSMDMVARRFPSMQKKDSLKFSLTPLISNYRSMDLP